jgi:hypothetical protein
MQKVESKIKLIFMSLEYGYPTMKKGGYLYEGA